MQLCSEAQKLIEVRLFTQINGSTEQLIHLKKAISLLFAVDFYNIIVQILLA